MKKILSMLLILCFLLTALIACGEETAATESGAGSESASATGPLVQGGTLASTNEYGENDFVSAVPVDELDFEGETITLMIRNHERYIREFGKTTVADDDILDQAIKLRDEQVASELNIVLVPTYHASGDAGLCFTTYVDVIKNDVQQDLHEYDVAAHFGYMASAVEIRDFSANLLDKDMFPYLDFTLPCWNQSVVEHSNINGKSLVCAGDITLSIFDYAMVMWMNNTLYDDLRDEDDPENIQDLVIEGIGKKGGWTAADLYKWSNVYENSSSDECDTYGIYIQGESWDTQPTDNIPFCWDLDLMITNNDGTHAYNVVGNQKAEDAIVLFRDIYDGEGNGFLHVYGGRCNNGGCFTAGNIVFKGDVIFWDEAGNLALREMEDDYALIPWPKWDENQMDYYCSAQDCYTLLGVIDHYESTVPTKGEAVSAYLQLTCEKSYKDVRGMYFYKIVEPKFFGVDDTTGTVTKSQAIFRAIIDNLQFDYWALYSSSLGHIMHMFRGCAAHGTETLEKLSLIHI